MLFYKGYCKYEREFSMLMKHSNPVVHNIVIKINSYVQKSQCGKENNFISYYTWQYFNLSMKIIISFCNISKKLGNEYPMSIFEKI